MPGGPGVIDVYIKRIKWMSKKMTPNQSIKLGNDMTVNHQDTNDATISANLLSSSRISGIIVSLSN